MHIQYCTALTFAIVQCALYFTFLSTCSSSGRAGGPWLLHCKDKMPKIWTKYYQKRNIGVSVPFSTFMCLWANYIFPQWVCLFCRRKYVDRSWEYINRSQTHECGNWGWGRAIPRKGIYKRNCCCSVERTNVLGVTTMHDHNCRWNTSRIL